MPETQVPGTQIADKSITHLDINLSGAPSVSPCSGSIYLAMVDTDNLTKKIALSTVETYFNDKYAPKTSGNSYIQNQNSAAQEANLWIDGSVKGNVILSTVADGTAPLTVTSSTMVSKLFAEHSRNLTFPFGSFGSSILDIALTPQTLTIDGALYTAIDGALYTATDMFPFTNMANSLLSIGSWTTNEYGDQLGFSSDGNVYHRRKNAGTWASWNKFLTGNGYVPYTGATTSLDMGSNDISAITINANQFTGVTVAQGTIRNNLSNPSVTEMALIHGEFNNKFRFFPATSQEESTDGTTWTTSNRLASYQLADLMLGEGQTNDVLIIPFTGSGQAGYYRLTWDISTTPQYVFLNAVYLYSTTCGNIVAVKIEAYNSFVGWVTISSGTVSNWPGHSFMPHGTIPYHYSAPSSGYYNKVRLSFAVTSSINEYGIYLGGIEWFGGYPAGRRNVEYYDRLKTVYFPNGVVANGIIDGTTGTFSSFVSMTSSTGWSIGNYTDHSRIYYDDLSTFYMMKPNNDYANLYTAHITATTLQLASYFGSEDLVFNYSGDLRHYISTSVHGNVDKSNWMNFYIAQSSGSPRKVMSLRGDLSAVFSGYLEVSANNVGTGGEPTYTGSIRIKDSGGSTSSTGGLEFFGSNYSNGYGWRITAPDSEGVNLHFQSRTNSASWSDRMTILSNGNVGIEITSPLTQLHIAGQFTTDVTESAPFVISSTYHVANLNADMLDGQHASEFASASHTHSGYAVVAGSNTQLQFNYSGSLGASAYLTWTNGTKTLYMQILKHGQVGIRQTTPGGRLLRMMTRCRTSITIQTNLAFGIQEYSDSDQAIPI